MGFDEHYLELEDLTEEALNTITLGFIDYYVQKYLFRNNVDKLIYNYTTDIRLAYEVIKHINDQGYYAKIESPTEPKAKLPTDSSFKWYCGFTQHGVNDIDKQSNYFSYGITLEIAICKAALIWVRDTTLMNLDTEVLI